MANIITTNNSGLWGNTNFTDPFRIFDDVFGRTWASPSTTTRTTTNTQVTEQDDTFQVNVAAPGLTRKDFDVKIKETGNRNVMTVAFTADDTNTFTRGSFTRSWTLPRNTTADGVTATYRSGILTVTVPKTDTTQDDNEFVVTVK